MEIGISPIILSIRTCFYREYKKDFDVKLYRIYFLTMPIIIDLTKLGKKGESYFERIALSFFNVVINKLYGEYSKKHSNNRHN